MKIFTVLGARPQFIKASVVSAAIAKHPDLEEILVHTGQHFDANMSDVFFRELGISPPQYNLSINGGTHGAMTGRMLIEVERLMIADRPDIVLVYGDTNSTLAGALAAAKLHIPIAHVEAGLRSFNMKMPEEVNRIVTDRLSHWLFAPTTDAVQHLKHEGLDERHIHNVGDVMYDVALYHGRRADSLCSETFEQLGIASGTFALVTVHRAENTDDISRLRIIIRALEAVGMHMPVIWPVHPRTRGILNQHDLLGGKATGIKLIEPVGYLDMVRLERHSAVIVTDSGGVQKEAFFHQVPCVTLRDETEWTELVSSGWNRLAPPKSIDAIAMAILAAREHRGQSCAPYGDGRAAEKIVAHLAAGVSE